MFFSVIRRNLIKGANVSKHLFGLTMVDDQPKTLDDSFSSNKDSNFNKGAAAFLALVEKSLADSSSVKLDQLLIEMMDLGINEKINTASDIPDVLNSQGWSMKQVAGVWSVPTDTVQEDSWDILALKRVCGSKILADVWESLRLANKAGHHKRPAPTEDTDCLKRFKADTGTKTKVIGVDRPRA